MALYELGVRCTSNAIETAQWELRSSATNSPRLYEVWLSNPSALGVFGFGVPLVRGVTPTLISLPPHDPSDPVSQSNMAVAWVTSPVIPTAANAFTRRITMNNTLGDGVVLTWPLGYRLLPNTSFAMFNIATGSQTDTHLTIDE